MQKFQNQANHKETALALTGAGIIGEIKKNR